MMNIMMVYTHGKKYAEGLPGVTFISSPQDAVDLIGACGERNTQSVLLHAENVDASFFELKSRLAGEVMQKLVNYRMRAAMVLPADYAQNDRFREMARETNRGSHFGIFTTAEDAAAWLTE